MEIHIMINPDPALEQIRPPWCIFFTKIIISHHSFMNAGAEQYNPRGCIESVYTGEIPIINPSESQYRNS